MVFRIFDRKSVLTAVVALSAIVLAGQAHAEPLLSFDDDARLTTGTVSHTTGGPAVGTDISFFSLIGENTPVNNNVQLDCVGCRLNFTTGNVTFEGTSAPGDNWQFGPGGVITVTGTLEDNGNQVANGTLLTGRFTSAAVQGSGNSLTLTGFGLDEKHPDLLAFWGVQNTDFQFAATTISLASATFGPNNDFSARVSNADLDNIGIPVPATLGLLGLGLMGLGFAVRRRG